MDFDSATLVSHTISLIRKQVHDQTTLLCERSSFPRPLLSDLTQIPTKDLENRTRSHNARLAVTASNSPADRPYNLSQDWPAAFASSLTSDGRAFRINRPVSAQIPGIKAFDKSRQEIVNISTLPTFKEYFEKFTCGALHGFKFDFGCGVAGGSVLDSLLGDDGQNSAFQDSDIDIFFHDITHKQANRKVRQLERVLRSNDNNYDRSTIIVRTPTTISFTPNPEHRIPGQRSIQVILTIYRSLTEILSNFDLSICSMAFNGKDVFMLPRAIQALHTGYLPVSDYIVGSSPARFLKYGQRGYGTSICSGEHADQDPVPAVFESARLSVQATYKEMKVDKRTRLDRVMGPFVFQVAQKYSNRWTESLQSLARLSAVWEFASGDFGTEKALMISMKARNSFYDLYNEPLPVVASALNAEFMEAFHQMDFINAFTDSDSDCPSTKRFVPGVARVSGPSAKKTCDVLLTATIILPVGFVAAMPKSSRYSLKIKKGTQTVSDDKGIKFQLCDWTIHPSTMWNPSPFHHAAPMLNFLKQASMLTLWAVRRTLLGAPWVDLQFGRTFWLAVQPAFLPFSTTEDRIQQWLRS
ncbi:hypothetical protein A4X13_0g7500 [Tilletia indica]|uniref:Uncharacterized protein n=1 Tax=Tilletia indica TaxID=43049 RepID=A0A8T8SJZ6_9BASI|nr:hypothetical protein A4X13_0g7500 [Tilletia indica]